MLTNKHKLAVRKLIELGYAERGKPRERFAIVTGNQEADKLVNNLSRMPHAFVVACLMDRQIKAERAWQIPYELQQRLGYFDIGRLSRTRQRTFRKAMTSPSSLHRYHSMSNLLFDAIQMIANTYHGRASRIWTGKPSSATVVQRFLEFHGIGPKIATMAANILAREFKIPFGDYYSIDISVDTHTRRVLKRLGLAPEAATNEYIIYTARSFHPEYPGVIDLALYRLGKSICNARDPQCAECSFSNLCTFALTSQ